MVTRDNGYKGRVHVKVILNKIKINERARVFFQIRFQYVKTLVTSI